MLPSDPPAPVASAPEYKLAPTANATLAPLTADERTMRGRWGVNIDGILKIAKEKPEELGLPAGALKEEITKQMLLTLPFFKSITLELNDDRGAVFVCAGTLLEETWHIDAGHVALDGLAELNELSLQREENQAAFGSPGMNSRGVPAKLMPRGVAITSAKLAGQWTVDIDASVKFTRPYWQDVFAIMPAVLKEKQELFFQGCRRSWRLRGCGCALAARRRRLSLRV